MATSTILTLGKNPAGSKRTGPEGITTFRFTDIWTPEGDLRITMYRPYSPSVEPATKSGFDAVLDHRLIVNLPTYSVEVQKFLQNPTINGFKLTVFDSGNIADVIVNGQSFDPIIGLARLVNFKLFTRYIKPYYETNVYCQIEFKEKGAADFELLTIGELDSVVEGDEKLLITGTPNPNSDYLYTEGRDYVLHETVTQEYDSIRIFDLSFSHIGQTALGKLKSKATPFSSDKDLDPTLLLMPLYPSTDPPYDTLMIGGFGAKKEKKVVQQVFEELYTDKLGLVRHALWRRHINASVYVKLVLDQSLGEGQWEFECDDSPFTFTGGVLQNDFRVVGIKSDTPRTPNLSMDINDINQKWFLLPQTLFGFWDDLIADQIPKVKNAWSNRFPSQFECFTELAFTLGYVVTMDSLSPLVTDPLKKKKTKVTFRRRDRMGEEFETLLPFESHIIAYPDTESGIEVKHGETFDNAETLHDKFDDFDAVHTSAEKVDEFIRGKRFAANPYIVPQTATEAAKLEVSMCFGDMSGYPGYVYGWPYHTVHGKDVQGLIGWYMTGHPDYPPGLNKDDKPSVLLHNNPSIQPMAFEEIYTAKRTEDFPTLTPLIAIAGGPIDENINPATQTAVTFAPVMRASFQYKTIDNKIYTVVCTSLRQLLARYLTIFFSRPSAQIVRKYPTITQFRDKLTQVASWKNMKLFNISKLPTVGFHAKPTDNYYVTGYTFDFNNCSTETKYLPASFLKPIREIKFHDDTEFPPDGPPVPPVITVPDPPAEPLCGVHDIIFGILLNGNCVAWIEFYIDGIFISRQAGVDPEMSGEESINATLHIDACDLSIGLHTVTMKVILCDGTVIEATWTFNVIHGCC